MLERLGIADEVAARREQFKRYAYRAPSEAAKTHRITVNLATGERTVESTDETATVSESRPPIVRVPATEPDARIRVERIRIWCTTRPRGSTDNYRAATPDTRGRVSDVIAAAADTFGVTVEELLSPRKTNRLAFCRFAAVHFLHNVLRISLTSIGKAIHRDHTSCLSALRRAQQMRRTDLAFAGRSRMLARELRRKWSAK